MNITNSGKATNLVMPIWLRWAVFGIFVPSFLSVPFAYLALWTVCIHVKLLTAMRVQDIHYHVHGAFLQSILSIWKGSSLLPYVQYKVRCCLKTPKSTSVMHVLVEFLGVTQLGTHFVMVLSTETYYLWVFWRKWTFNLGLHKSQDAMLCA